MWLLAGLTIILTSNSRTPESDESFGAEDELPFWTQDPGLPLVSLIAMVVEKVLVMVIMVMVMVMVMVTIDRPNTTEFVSAMVMVCGLVAWWLGDTYAAPSLGQDAFWTTVFLRLGLTLIWQSGHVCVWAKVAARLRFASSICGNVQWNSVVKVVVYRWCFAFRKCLSHLEGGEGNWA